MPVFQKKPVQVEAHFLPDPQKGAEEAHAFTEVAAWCGGEKIIDAVDGPCVLIDTLEGQMKAIPGNMIIRGVEGEFYPCRMDIFSATYEQVGL